MGSKDFKEHGYPLYSTSLIKMMKIKADIRVRDGITELLSFTTQFTM